MPALWGDQKSRASICSMDEIKNDICFGYPRSQRSPALAVITLTENLRLVRHESEKLSDWDRKIDSADIAVNMAKLLERTADAVISKLRAHEAELRAAGIRHLSLFGSVARGEAEAGSDIDLAAEVDRDAHLGLFGLAALERRLSEILGRKVDLLSEPVEKQRQQRNIDRDRRRAFYARSGRLLGRHSR